jgi:hypothetical protein
MNTWGCIPGVIQVLPLGLKCILLVKPEKKSLDVYQKVIKYYINIIFDKDIVPGFVTQFNL